MSKQVKPLGGEVLGKQVFILEKRDTGAELLKSK